MGKFNVNTLNSAIIRQFKMHVVNTHTSNSKVLAVLAGNYVKETFETTGTETLRTVCYRNSPTLLNNAGYQADQVADDVTGSNSVADRCLTISGDSRCSVRTFQEEVRTKGVKVSKITIQGSSNDIATALFNGQIAIGQMAIGANGGIAYINLQDYVSVDAYDRTKIEIVFDANDPLEFDADTFLSINCPASTNFDMQFALVD